FSIGSQTFTFDINDIYFVEASKLPHRLSLCTKDGQYEFYGRISELEKKYPMLTRISRACLVNIFNVKEIDFKKRSLYFDSELARNFTLGKAQKIKEKLK
ncbi:DNA-binding response regulator, partial [Enterococcus faecium]